MNKSNEIVSNIVLSQCLKMDLCRHTLKSRANFSSDNKSIVFLATSIEFN